MRASGCTRRSSAEIQYEEAPDKAAAYGELEPVFAQGRIEILDHPQLIRELKLLERRPRSGGRDVVDHPRGYQDDYANSLALATMEAMTASGQPTCGIEIWG